MRLCVRVVRGLALSLVILSGILAGAGVATVALTGAALAQASSVVVEGNRRVESDTVRSYFRPGPGGRLGPVEIDEGLKSLYATGLFSDVRINQAGCLNRCEEGPLLVIYPEGTWYTYVDTADIDEIIDRHLAKGEIVERLKI